jgi:uncharacterized RmlC-like cupin family protein
MLSRRLTVEYGDDSIESATAIAGDFVVVPAGVIHREVVPLGADVAAVVVRHGDGAGPLAVDATR